MRIDGDGMVLVGNGVGVAMDCVTGVCDRVGIVVGVGVVEVVFVLETNGLTNCG
jgi:hypothetical protein